MNAMIAMELELHDISFSNLGYINELRGMIVIILISQFCNYQELSVEGFDKKKRRKEIWHAAVSNFRYLPVRTHKDRM